MSHQHFECQIFTKKKKKKKSLSAPYLLSAPYFLNQMMDSGQTLCIVSLG